jgi:hypothetical protein
LKKEEVPLFLKRGWGGLKLLKLIRKKPTVEWVFL